MPHGAGIRWSNRGERLFVNGLVFLVFPSRAQGRKAWLAAIRRSPSNEPRAPRIHDGALDPMLAVDLSGTPAQGQREQDVLRRFAFVFGLFTAAGLAIDLSGWIGDAGLAATMGMGSIGTVVGTLSVLLAPHQSLDTALTEADERLTAGECAVTIPTTNGQGESGRHLADHHGGRVLFEA